MKTALNLILVTIFAFATSSFAGEEYTAPKLKLSAAPHADTVVNDAQWESGLEFKVQERPHSDRGVASDEETKPARNPSSNPAPTKSGILSDEHPKPWRFQK
jgi:hypothetical protein